MAFALEARGRFWRSPAVRFPLHFVVLLSLLVLVGERLLTVGPAMVGITTAVVDWVASAAGLTASRGAEGMMTFADGEFGYQVVPACTTAVPSFLYMAAVLAFPATWRQRGIGLLLGIPVLFAFNILRLVILAWVGVHASNTFDLLHWFGFQVFFVFVVGIVWVAWIALIVQGDRTSDRTTRFSWRPRISVPVFAGVVVALGALGSSGPVQRLYARFFNIPLALAEQLWGDRSPPTLTHDDLLIYYGTFATVTALFLGTRLDLGARMSGLFEGLMLLFALQAVDLFTLMGLNAWQISAGGQALTNVMYAAWEGTHLIFLGLLPCLYWLTWARKNTSQESLPTPLASGSS